MSAKLTIIFFILICFEIGALLILLPWINYPSWNQNYLLFLAAERLDSPGLARFVTSGYFRGAVTGLGVLNVAMGILEVKNFKKTVQTFQVEWQGAEPDGKIFEPSSLPDNRPADASSHEQ
ncbi:MAG TPA: hypothetical protein VE262_11715 [Blastocatellia bacterium]|nr:hypothetical protein [Blastocatellia bacterium]